MQGLTFDKCLISLTFDSRGKAIIAALLSSHLMTLPNEVWIGDDELVGHARDNYYLNRVYCVLHRRHCTGVG